MSSPIQARVAASRAAIQRQVQAQAMAPPALARLAREHPWALVGAAAMAGAGLVVMRPWHWLPRPSVLGSLVAQLAWQALATRLTARAPAPPDGDWPRVGAGRR